MSREEYEEIEGVLALIRLALKDDVTNKNFGINREFALTQIDVVKHLTIQHVDCQREQLADVSTIDFERKPTGLEPKDYTNHRC